jgi:hypothetical protein
MPGRHTKADYKKHYDEYQSRPDVMKKRALNNKARAMLIKEKGAAALKGKDVHHVKPQRSGGATVRSNLKVVSVATNRGWQDDEKKKRKR